MPLPAPVVRRLAARKGVRGGIGRGYPGYPEERGIHSCREGLSVGVPRGCGEGAVEPGVIEEATPRSRMGGYLMAGRIFHPPPTEASDLGKKDPP